MAESRAARLSRAIASGKLSPEDRLVAEALSRVKRPVFGKSRFTAKQIQDAVRAVRRERQERDARS